jgi:hypothetical protein
MVDSQAFQMMPIPDGLLRAVWRARRGIWTIARSPSKVVVRAAKLRWQGPCAEREIAKQTSRCQGRQADQTWGLRARTTDRQRLSAYSIGFGRRTSA